MKINNIEVSGIISPEEIKNYSFDYPCKEICKTFIVSIPENKLPVDKLIYIFVNADVNESKINSTYREKKLFLDAYFKSQIIYISNLQSPTIHSIDILRPFSEFLPIPDKIDDIYPLIFIQDAFVKQISPREILISLFLLLCPSVNDIVPLEQPSENLNIENNIEDLNVENNLNPVEVSNATTSTTEDLVNYSQPMQSTSSKDFSNKTSEEGYNVAIEYDMNSSEELFEFEWE